MSAKVAFIGLGVMGFPMAGHLKAKGYDVVVYNRTGSKAEAWAQKHGGRTAPTPAAAAKDCDFVMLMVGNDSDLLEVALGKDGALSGMKKGAVLVDHTTASADVARKVFAEAKAKGVDLSTRRSPAARREPRTASLGDVGEGALRAREAPDGPYGRAVTPPRASGQLTKMVNQICIAGLVQALSEGIAFAEKAGLDPTLVLDVISKGAAQSWQMENRGKTMVERKFNFGFAVDWMRKDLGICLEEAKRNGAKLPVTEIVDKYYGDVQKAGGNRFDTSSLITRL